MTTSQNTETLEEKQLKKAILADNPQKVNTILNKYQIDATKNNFELLIIGIRKNNHKAVGALINNKYFIADTEKAGKGNITRALADIFVYLHPEMKEQIQGKLRVKEDNMDNELTLRNGRGGGFRGGGRGGFGGGHYHGGGRGGYYGGGAGLAAGLGTGFLLGALASPRYGYGYGYPYPYPYPYYGYPLYY